MCGIFGIINKNGLIQDLNTLRAARDQLSHRGPDAAGEYYDDKVYLGFRRLAILDLSPLGNQPMFSEDHKIGIVFNGEIYNYMELKTELEKKGYIFRSTSDTEVLIYLYKEYHENMFSKLNGMFAMAIYDLEKMEIVFARDRVGKKPLFIWYDRDTLAFASEIRALKKLPKLEWNINSQALGLYFRFGWVPGFTSIYEKLYKIPPATWVRFNITNGQLSVPTKYWDLNNIEIEYQADEKVWMDRIEELLWDATMIRLRSDVPVGVLLSGGIDSGLITAASKEQSNSEIDSFTIGFPGWIDDESELAKKTAVSLSVNHIFRELEEDVINLLPNIMGHFDEPFADGSALPTALICQTAREHITVALSGDGGDEVMAGYQNHLRAMQWRWLEKIPFTLRKHVSHNLVNITRRDSRLRRFVNRLGYPVGCFGIGGKLYPFEDWVEDLVEDDYKINNYDIERVFKDYLYSHPKKHPVDEAQQADLRLYLVDDILVKVDRMSMLHSLEVRSPFLDYRLIELALRVPPELRVKQQTNKYLLRNIAKRHLPQEVVWAPKRGFGIPLEKWFFHSRYTDQLKDVAFTPSIYAPEPIKKNGAEILWKMAESNPSLTAALFRLLCYRWWVDSALGN